MTLLRNTLAVRHVIMLMLILLVMLFIGGMWLMSSLNLGFAESTMSELRQRQINDTFHANLDRIDAHHRQMEQNTLDLARLGEWLERFGAGEGVFREALVTTLADFPDAHGASLYLTAREASLGLYAYRDGDRIELEEIDTDWPSNDWFQERMAAGQSADSPDFHWTPAYYKSRIDDAVISLSLPLAGSDGEPLGIAATDWSARDIIGLVSGVEVTPGTFAFLVDSENRNLSSLALEEDVQGAQRLIDAVIDLDLQDQVPEDTPGSGIQQRSLTVNGEDWALFHAMTRAGMVFGVGVPQSEIDAVLVPMRESNLRIVLLIGTALILLAGLILFMVAGTLKQLRNLYTDPLTGLPNRARLLIDLGRPQPASLILLNIDSFREINDFYGHDCGDHVIVQMGEALQRILRDDPDWQGCRLYRMPADEMAIWLPGDHEGLALVQRLEALHRRISSLALQWRGQEVPLQATLGLACSRDVAGDAAEGESLLTSANIAVKSARQTQRHFLIYDPAQRVREAYEHNLIWANRLKLALSEGRVVPYFQPILNLATGRVGKFECLVRMLDEQGRPISPGQFLGVAKKIRLYREITRTMVVQSIQRFSDSDQEFSLNLSCEDLTDPALTDFILAQLAEHRIGSRVIFEILESEGIDNYDLVRDFIDRAKALGCRIAIDDFGTGYSNFEHLLRLDVDLIKVDGSLIRKLDTEPDARTLTRGIVHFAAELGMQTVAEFVHSPAILSQVRELGIDFAQGACIGMPEAQPVTTLALPREFRS